MSRYAWFACFDCRVGVWLGKAIFNDREQVDHFKIGSSSVFPNWQNTDLNRVIWKILADHAGHTLHVVVEGEPLDELFEDFTLIGGFKATDPSYTEYTSGWDTGT